MDHEYATGWSTIRNCPGGLLTTEQAESLHASGGLYSVISPSVKSPDRVLVINGLDKFCSVSFLGENRQYFAQYNFVASADSNNFFLSIARYWNYPPKASDWNIRTTLEFFEDGTCKQSCWIVGEGNGVTSMFRFNVADNFESILKFGEYESIIQFHRSDSWGMPDYRSNDLA